MAVERTLPTPESEDLLDLVRALVGKELTPRAATEEEKEAFPRDVFIRLGRAGLLGLPYPAAYGGGDQPMRCTCRSWRSWRADGSPWGSG